MSRNLQTSLEALEMADVLRQLLGRRGLAVEALRGLGAHVALEELALALPERRLQGQAASPRW